MIRTKLILTLALLLSAASQSFAQQPTQPCPPAPLAGITVTKAVYYCNAPTKKGTPCKHRVKHQGDRCWQHKEAK